MNDGWYIKREIEALSSHEIVQDASFGRSAEGKAAFLVSLNRGLVPWMIVIAAIVIMMIITFYPHCHD